MKLSLKKGFGFGLTSGVLTTLGMLIGLATVSESRSVIIGGILSIAIADSVSDAMGIHISEESNKESKLKTIWEATISTFISKFIFALTFLIPVIFLNIKWSLIISTIWGVSLISGFSYKIARERNESAILAISEHLGIMAVVLIVINVSGRFINYFFN